MFRRRNATASVYTGGATQSQKSSSSASIPAIARSSPEPVLEPEDTISSSEYARKCRELMDLYKNLKDLGCALSSTCSERA